MPPGVDIERFRPLDADERLAARRQFGLPTDGELIVSISRLVPRKGFDVAIEAVALLAPRRPDLVLAISGGGRDERRLRRLAAERDAPVRFLGRVANDDLPALYGCGDVFAMVCRTRWGGLEQEGFGIVFVEAAACGVPQVAGESGGAAEAVDDGVTGLVVDRPDDPTAVAEAFEALLDDPAKRADDGDGVAGSVPSPSSPTTCWPSAWAGRSGCGEATSDDTPARRRARRGRPRRHRAVRRHGDARRGVLHDVLAVGRRRSPRSALFAVGVFAFLWSYYNAVQRSRRDEIGVAELYLLLGPPTPPRVRRLMLGALAAQVVIAVATTFARLDGPDGKPGSSLALGFLVPMFGFGLNGLWAAYHGRFPPATKVPDGVVADCARWPRPPRRRSASPRRPSGCGRSPPTSSATRTGCAT